MRNATAIGLLAAACLLGQGRTEISIQGTQFNLNNRPFPFTGVSFFNALYNQPFNESSPARTKWLARFKQYGINVLRVWAQWDSTRGFVDTCTSCTLYHPDGRLRRERVNVLKQLLSDADREGVVIELALFSHESYAENIRIGATESQAAVAQLTKELQPWRNLVFQIWNEHTDENVLPLVKAIRAVDSKRLITNSPGFAGVLGSVQENTALDFLTPHTTRSGRHWDVAGPEISYLLARFRKPVVDDEPARNGTPQFGGPRQPTDPVQHILQIADVWRRGGYVIYHHDMFQTGAGSPAVPPSGVPDPEFNPYHRTVFEFLAKRERFMPEVSR